MTSVSAWRPPVAEVPTGEEIEISGRSDDVIHGFYVPRLHFQRQFLPGYVTRFDLRFASPGFYGGACSVFCGPQHTEMHFELRAVSRPGFETWLGSGAEAGSQRKRGAPRERGGDAARARRGRALVATDHKRIAAQPARRRAHLLPRRRRDGAGDAQPSSRSRACRSSRTEAYNALFTMHGSTMIYLVVTPVALALGVYLVPLQVGAAEIAGPRLALRAVAARRSAA